MSLDKAIERGKERRKPYYKAGKHDKTCRPHGRCAYCADNRAHKQAKHDQEKPEERDK